MFSTIVYGVLALILACYFLEWAFSLRDEANEPPRAKSRIPLFGHILGLLRQGALYFFQVR
jgi:hypothetical protein